MTGERPDQSKQPRTRWALSCAAPVLALLLAGCGSTSLSSLNLLDSNKATNDAPAESGGVGNLSNDDVDCPPIQVRTGAATLMIGGGGKPDEPAALNLRYQGSIIRYARECHINAGVMTMRVGIEGRVITGPAGGPGKVDVPLRIAVVQEGVAPKAIASKFTLVPVEMTSAVDRVTFTHIEEGVTFPVPSPPGLLDAYVVYIGFDTLAAQQQGRKPAARKKR